jgi:gliding motility-associated-like protein
MMKFILTLFFLLNISLSNFYSQTHSSNLFENAEQLCFDQLLTSNNLNANSTSSFLNVNFDSLISCFDIVKSTFYKFNTNEFGGNAELSINAISCTGDSNIIFQNSIEVLVFTFENQSSFSNFQLIETCSLSSSEIMFSLNNLLPNHSYFLLVNGYSSIDTLVLNSVCNYNLNILGSGVKPYFSAGNDIYTFPNSEFQLNAFGQGVPVWYPDYFFDSTNSYNPVLTLGETTELLLNMEEFNGCSYKDSLKVFVKNPLVFHNIITPNNDGINDIWVVDNSENYPQCQVSIFDKNGVLIFNSIGYNNFKYWDGSLNGSFLAAGTYYYIFNSDANSSDDLFQGFITLLR